MRRHRSLHIGLNYPNTDAELAGCLNDAVDWQDLFSGLGYDTWCVVEPTKAQAVDAITSRLSGLTWGDRFVLTWSGHGSWIPDRDGDEPDGRDEVLCPADFERNVLVDDELYALIQERAAGVRVTIFSDSCHSGSVHRWAPLRDVGRAAVPRYMPPAKFLPPSLLVVGAVLVSGCADTEYSYDAWFHDRANGAFTRMAIDTFDGQTMRGWHAAIRGRLPSSSYPQSPQLQARYHQRFWRL
jgi:hypothetical protein